MNILEEFQKNRKDFNEILKEKYTGLSLQDFFEKLVQELVILENFILIIKFSSQI